MRLSKNEANAIMRSAIKRHEFKSISWVYERIQEHAGKGVSNVVLEVHNHCFPLVHQYLAEDGYNVSVIRPLGRGSHEVNVSWK
jgi:hypothetical protein